jgi:putative transposase
MHVKPVRYQNQRCLHFITFSCYHRMPLLDTSTAKDTFEQTLERVRARYACYITGYVVKPEHVYVLISELERSKLDAQAHYVTTAACERFFGLCHCFK